jgi:hypothetical protein
VALQLRLLLGCGTSLEIATVVAAYPQLVVPHPDRQQRLDLRRDAGAVDELLQVRQRGRAAHRLAPSSATASVSLSFPYQVHPASVPGR